MKKPPTEPNERPLNRYAEYVAAHSLRMRMRRRVRDASIFLLSHLSRVPHGSTWIRFPYYHHVFDDERSGFEHHIRYMQDIGEIISLPDALALLESGDPLDGRYFCISFDDGFKNCATNAVPILLDRGISAAFFLPTRYIGTPAGRDGHLEFYKPLEIVVEFLSWEECREMSRAGMTIGSHTVSHPFLSELSAADVERELRDSKEKIERELQMPCEYFCCPTGRPSVDFNVERDPAIARRLGYRSFLTTRRGSVHRKPDPMQLERDHAIAEWDTYQLRYFFSR